MRTHKQRNPNHRLACGTTLAHCGGGEDFEGEGAALVRGNGKLGRTNPSVGCFGGGKPVAV